MGRLLDLCEENYELLMDMAPELRQMEGVAASSRSGQMDLYLDVLEQTPYTTVVHLTYYFSHQLGQFPDPDAVLRLYHDAHQIEVISLKQSALPLEFGYQYPSLYNKWKVNLFLAKWLAFCLHQGHQFASNEEILTELLG